MAASSIGRLGGVGVDVEQGVGVVLGQGGGERGGHLAVGRPAAHGPVPVPEHAQAQLPRPQNLFHANGDALPGHILQRAAQVAHAVGGPRLRVDVQHPGGDVYKRQLFTRLSVR